MCFYVLSVFVWFVCEFSCNVVWFGGVCVCFVCLCVLNVCVLCVIDCVMLDGVFVCVCGLCDC